MKGKVGGQWNKIFMEIFIPLHRSPERERERQEMAPANP